MVQKSYSGPIMCIKAPNVVIANRNAIKTVNEMTKAKVSKNTKLAKKRKKPQKNVVILPLKIAPPISLNDYCILSALVGWDECIKSVDKCKT